MAMKSFRYYCFFDFNLYGYLRTNLIRSCKRRLPCNEALNTKDLVSETPQMRIHTKFIELSTLAPNRAFLFRFVVAHPLYAPYKYSTLSSRRMAKPVRLPEGLLSRSQASHLFRPNGLNGLSPPCGSGWTALY